MVAILPYNSISIDSNYDHFFKAIKQCLTCREADTIRLNAELQTLWRNKDNPNHVLPCLSVRTGLDLFLQAQAYPLGSEIIMSAINIQDVAQVIRNQGLKITTVDICIDSLEPKLNLLERLITSKTVAILVAHLYGRWIDMEPIIALAERYGLHVIEDCAECFCGFSRLGHVKSDICLFSFGAIKFSTSFGGAVAKVRDKGVLDRMMHIHSQYPVQSNQVYLKKVLKYCLLFTMLYTWPIPHLGQRLCQYGCDPKDIFVKYIRGFPSQMIESIRHQPSPALLSVMLHTHSTFDRKAFDITRIKGDYFLSRLTSHMYPVGSAVNINNFWLFPVLVKNPQETVKCLNIMGLAAYRGSTQLSVIEADAPDSPLELACASLPGESSIPAKGRKPLEAQYLIDHVIYLPVSKLVPFWALDQMLEICSKVMKQLSVKGNNAVVKQSSVMVPCKSKL